MYQGKGDCRLYHTQAKIILFIGSGMIKAARIKALLLHRVGQQREKEAEEAGFATATNGDVSHGDSETKLFGHSTWRLASLPCYVLFVARCYS
jgi:hypothetical protein